MSLTGERPDYGPFELPKKILDSAFSPQCYKSHFFWHVAAHSLLLWHPAHPSGIEETNLVPLGRQPSEVSAIGQRTQEPEELPLRVEELRVLA